MTPKEHYQKYLGNFYSWMSGDFNARTLEQQQFFLQRQILPDANVLAFDLGAGHGIQALPLARLGFKVKAVDYTAQLLSELNQNKGQYQIELLEDDILHFLRNTNEKAGLIVCMGDTITHLASIAEIRDAVVEVHRLLSNHGKFVVSFRDLTGELTGTSRFIPVRSSEQKILTCFLEYFPDHVTVHDILYEKNDGEWQQKVSSYPKVRIGEQEVRNILESAGFRISSSETVRGMCYIVAEKC